MKSFRCQACSQLIFFENGQCLRCRSLLGYLPNSFTMTALEPVEEGAYRALADNNQYQFCKNGRDWNNCNWLIPAGSTSPFCLSCQLTETIPDLGKSDNRAYWRTLEQGKRRLIYSLLRLGLPVRSKKQGTDGLAFQFLRPDPSARDSVRTGHKNGMITVDVREADDVERERTRMHLNEVYRTVLGHFRHESGHYYWWQLIQDKAPLERFRELFGDERQDYKKSINNYYSSGPAANWQNEFVSAYASSHPWEDFAESWAHYLTIVDALETALEFGVEVTLDHTQPLFPRIDSYRARTFDEMLDQWLPLTFAMNSINRSGGQPDLYPFILPGPAIEKLRFVHGIMVTERERQDVLKKAATGGRQNEQRQ